MMENKPGIVQPVEIAAEMQMPSSEQVLDDIWTFENQIYRLEREREHTESQILDLKSRINELDLAIKQKRVKFKPSLDRWIGIRESLHADPLYEFVRSGLSPNRDPDKDDMTIARHGMLVSLHRGIDALQELATNSEVKVPIYADRVLVKKGWKRNSKSYIGWLKPDSQIRLKTVDDVTSEEDESNALIIEIDDGIAYDSNLENRRDIKKVEEIEVTASDLCMMGLQKIVYSGDQAVSKWQTELSEMSKQDQLWLWTQIKSNFNSPLDWIAPSGKLVIAWKRHVRNMVGNVIKGRRRDAHEIITQADQFLGYEEMRYTPEERQELLDLMQQAIARMAADVPKMPTTHLAQS